jgi:hypothetical protein
MAHDAVERTCKRKKRYESRQRAEEVIAGGRGSGQKQKAQRFLVSGQ